MTTTGATTMPKRIQRKRTKGWRMPDGVVYVGRPTKWGNPYNWQHSSRYSVCVWFKDDLLDAKLPSVGGKSPITCDEVRRELRGKDLACWCGIHDMDCHANVLLEIANS